MKDTELIGSDLRDMWAEVVDSCLDSQLDEADHTAQVVEAAVRCWPLAEVGGRTRLELEAAVRMKLEEVGSACRGLDRVHDVDSTVRRRGVEAECALGLEALLMDEAGTDSSKGDHLCTVADEAHACSLESPWGHV